MADKAALQARADAVTAEADAWQAKVDVIKAQMAANGGKPAEGCVCKPGDIEAVEAFIANRRAAAIAIMTPPSAESAFDRVNVQSAK